MSSILQQVQILTNVATPLVVALLCLYAYYRRISKDDLLLWAAAHLVLALTFLAVNIAPPTGDPANLPFAWQLSLYLYFCTSGLILFGVLAADNAGVSFRLGLLISVAAASAMIALGSLHPALMMYVSLPLNPLAYLAAAVILIWRRRSAAHVIAGLVLLLRTVNGLVFVVTVIRTDAYALPGVTSTLSVFLNFLTGISLIAIAMENSWTRLNRSLAETRDARQEADAILDLAPISILRKDTDLNVVKANQNALDMAARLGRRIGSFVTLRSSDVLPAVTASRMEQLDRRAMSDPEAGVVEQEVSFDHPDDEKITLLMRKRAVLDDSGNCIGVMSVGLDITHLKEIEQKLREQIVLAEQASKAKSDFLAHMSHELRTPLNGIGGFAEMLAAGYLGPLNARQKEYVDSILASSGHMLSLVSDILDLSRLDAGRLTLTYESADLGEIVAAAAAATRAMASEHGIRLDVVTRPAAIRAERNALLQVFIGLIGNAIKFNRPNGSVTVEQVDLDGRSVVRVSDTGFGMTMAQIVATGDPFLRGDPLMARKGGGSGLGLAISRGLIELHGGELRIESTIGRGTTVTVLL